jgi:hypothetical protein
LRILGIGHEKQIEIVINDKIKIFVRVGNNPENITEFNQFIPQEKIEIERKTALAFQFIRFPRIQYQGSTLINVVAMRIEIQTRLRKLSVNSAYNREE